MLDTIIEELNESTLRWSWWENSESINLGSCYYYSGHINCHIIKCGKTIDDVIESWRNEHLVVECRSALFILVRYMMYKKFGSEYCNKHRDKFFFLEEGNNRDALFSLPFNDDLTPVKEGSVSNALFQNEEGYDLDFLYLQGTVMHEVRESKFPLLDSSFQGENLIVYNREKNLMVGFLRDVKNNPQSGCYRIKHIDKIKQQLIDNGRNDFFRKYPKSKCNIHSITKLSKENKYITTIFSYEKRFTFNGKKYIKFK